VTRNIAAAETENRGDDETDDADADRGNESLSQDERSDQPMISDPTSAFVADWIPKLRARVRAPGRALDLAMGRRLHARLLARAGFQTFGVDIKRDVVADAARSASVDGLEILGWCADLEVYPLPRGAFDVVVVARYLQRSLMHAIRESLKDGGFILYETFTVRQLAHGKGPRSPDHLLKPGELRAAFPNVDVLFYEEVSAPEAVARLVAQAR
jgi:2-polyprenyl-3-methyl-5-hydroxy-6-metoxy-1,4-benzoquinol methylase